MAKQRSSKREATGRELIDPNRAGTAGAALGFFWALVAYLWHGLLGFPSVMSLLYADFWTNPGLLLYGLLTMVVSGYLTGWVFAKAYNRMTG